LVAEFYFELKRFVRLVDIERSSAMNGRRKNSAFVSSKPAGGSISYPTF
jgi:hypothetical protein